MTDAEHADTLRQWTPPYPDLRAAKERAITVLECVEDVATHLRFLATNIREAGDVSFALIDDDGVAPTFGLADQLELQAIRLVGVNRD